MELIVDSNGEDEPARSKVIEVLNLKFNDPSFNLLI
jgi:hypothetical protein